MPGDAIAAPQFSRVEGAIRTDHEGGAGVAVCQRRHAYADAEEYPLAVRGFDDRGGYGPPQLISVEKRVLLLRSGHQYPEFLTAQARD